MEPQIVWGYESVVQKTESNFEKEEKERCKIIYAMSDSIGALKDEKDTEFFLQKYGKVIQKKQNIISLMNENDIYISHIMP